MALTSVISDDNVVWTNAFLSTMVLEISSVQYTKPRKIVAVDDVVVVEGLLLERVSSIKEFTG